MFTSATHGGYMRNIIVALTAALLCLVAAPVAIAHTSKGTLVCASTTSPTPQFLASITGDSFPNGHHVRVSLKVVDLGSTIFDQVVLTDSPNGNQTFGPFVVNRQTTTSANATATFTIRDLTEQVNYIGTGGFVGKCGETPPVPPVPPTPPVPPVVPPAPPIPPAPPVPPVVPPATVVPPRVAKCNHVVRNGKRYIVCGQPKRHKCAGVRLPRVAKNGQRYTVCVHPKPIRPKFTG